MKENSVERRIREAAENPIDSRLNLIQYRKQKESALAHKSVCENVINYCENNKMMPIYAALILGVGSDAFKNSSFDKGYKKFNLEKVETCFSMAKMFQSKLGTEKQPSDVLWRLVSRYYTRKSTSLDDFTNDLDHIEMENACRGSYESLCTKLNII